MEINKALRILNEANFITEYNAELNEGKLSKVLGIGALALASLFGKAHAEVDNLDLKTADSTEIEEIKTALEQESDIDFCKLKNRGLICKDTNNSITIYPTETLEQIGISDDVTEIIFLDGYKNKNQISGVVFNYKDGSKKVLSHKIGERYGYVTELDEFDAELSKNIITPAEVEQKTSSLYKQITSAVNTPNKYKALEQKLLQNIDFNVVDVPENIFEIVNDKSYLTLSSEEIPSEIGGGYVKYNENNSTYIKCKDLKSIGKKVCTIYDKDYTESVIAQYDRAGNIESVKNVNDGSEFNATSNYLYPNQKVKNYKPGKTGLLLKTIGDDTIEAQIINGQIVKSVIVDADNEKTFTEWSNGKPIKHFKSNEIEEKPKDDSQINKIMSKYK